MCLEHHSCQDMSTPVDVTLGASRYSQRQCSLQIVQVDLGSMQTNQATCSCHDCCAAAVFQKLGAEEESMGQDRVPGFLRTHPLTQDRIKNVQKQLPAASLVYEASGCEETRKVALDSIFGPRSVVVRE